MGVDVGDRALMRARSWRWLRARLTGLFHADTRIARHFTPNEQHTSKGARQWR